jgi:multidrug efflux pump
VVVGAIVLFCGSIALGTLLKQEFFPASVRPELLVELNSAGRQQPGSYGYRC